MNIYQKEKGCFRPNNPTNSRSKWILCPSSTFPGKSYWFNLVTGEASWNNAFENGKIHPKDFEIPTQQYKYNYQEPSSPPFDTSPNLPNANAFAFQPHNYQFNNYPQMKPLNHYQSYNQSILNHRMTPPGFGQVPFPKYFSHVPLTNERASQPLFVQTSFNQPIINRDVSFPPIIKKSYDLKRKRDQVTQTFGDTSFSVHYTSQPLHKRFLNTTQADKETLFKMSYHNFSDNIEVPNKRCRVTFNCDDNNVNFNENDMSNNVNMNNFNQKYTQMFENEPKSNTNTDMWTTTELNEELYKISVREFDGNTLKLLNSKFKVDKETNTEIKKQKKSLFSPVHEMVEDKEMQLIEASENEPLNRLAKDDLRLRLLEIKSGLERNKNDDTLNNNHKTKTTTAIPNSKPPSAMKRVTFRDDYLFTHDDDRVDDDFENGFYEDKEPSHEIYSDDFEEVSFIKINIDRLKNLSSFVVKDVWYIAVDLLSLTKDYEFLIKLVNSVQQTLEKKNIDISKNILDCCTEKTNRGYYVVLITTDAELRRRCKHHDIPTFTIENIKEFVTEKDKNKPRNKTPTFTKRVPNSNSNGAFPNSKSNGNASFNTNGTFLNSESNGNSFFNSNEKFPVSKSNGNSFLNSKEAFLNSKSNGNDFLDDYPQTFLDKFEAQKSLNKKVLSVPERDKSNGFQFNSVEKLKFNEKSTFLKQNNDGKMFKIPKISKCGAEKRIDLESVIEEKLKKFLPSSKGVEQRFELAKDLWLCSFGQIVEDGLTYILQLNEETDLRAYPPPWTLLQAIKCIKIITKNANESTRLVVEKLLHIVYDFSVKDFINPNIRYDDFMHIFGLSYLLFEALKENPDLTNISKETLSYLDETFDSLNDVNAKPDSIFDRKLPTVSLDVSNDLVRDEGKKVTKTNEEVLEYLRRHYSQIWNENTVGTYNKDNNKDYPERDFKIIRTVGRDIKKITFTDNNRTKTIVMKEVIENTDENRNENDIHKNDIDNDEYDTGNTFFTDNNEPKAKVVRNICVIKEIEERLMKKKLYDNQNDNDISRNKNDKFDFANGKKKNFTKTNEFIGECENDKNVGNYNDGVDKYDIDIDDMSDKILSNAMTSDSGIVKSNESLYAQTVVEMFLSEIKSFFFAVLRFIKESASKITKGELSTKRQRKLIEKISIAIEGIRNLDNKIQSIINREATCSENSFKILLVKSGVDPDNVKTYRYRQVLTKCLEQIGILSDALNLLDVVARNEDISKTQLTKTSRIKGPFTPTEQRARTTAFFRALLV